MTPDCPDCAAGLPLYSLDEHGTLAEVSGLPGRPGHSLDDAHWFCADAIRILRFDSAKFYTCLDPDALALESPEEAIEELLTEGAWEPGESLRETLERIAPITVSAYTPRELEEGRLSDWAEIAVDDIEERWLDEYGGPDGQGCPSAEERKALARDIEAALLHHARRWHIWQCKRVASHEYSLEDVVELLGEPELRVAVGSRELLEVDE